MVQLYHGYKPQNWILTAKKVLQKIKDANIEHRIITGGNILRNDVVKYYDYVVTKSVNADIAHYNGFL